MFGRFDRLIKQWFGLVVEVSRAQDCAKDLKTHMACQWRSTGPSHIGKKRSDVDYDEIHEDLADYEVLSTV